MCSVYWVRVTVELFVNYHCELASVFVYLQVCLVFVLSVVHEGVQYSFVCFFRLAERSAGGGGVMVVRFKSGCTPFNSTLLATIFRVLLHVLSAHGKVCWPIHSFSIVNELAILIESLLYHIFCGRSVKQFVNLGDCRSDACCRLLLLVWHGNSNIVDCRAWT